MIATGACGHEYEASDPRYAASIECPACFEARRAERKAAGNAIRQRVAENRAAGRKTSLRIGYGFEGIHRV